MKCTLTRLTWLLPCLLGFASCAHTLEVTNLGSFVAPQQFDEPDEKYDVVVHQSRASDHTWYSNQVVKALSTRREFAHFSTKAPGQATSFEPDFVLTVTPDVDYSASGTNFFVNFPGGILFTPAWLGYGYTADITTKVEVHDATGNRLDELVVETPYTIRHSEFDRTWYPLFSFNIMNVLGGIYTASVYDSDITPQIQDAIADNYAEFVTGRIMESLRQLAATTE